MGKATYNQHILAPTLDTLDAPGKLDAMDATLAPDAISYSL